MIVDIYYACGLFYFLAQVTWIARPVKEAKRIETIYKKHNGDAKLIAQESVSSLQIIALIWSLLGLFTSDWMAFILLLVLIFLVVNPIVEISKFSKFYIALEWITSILQALFALFVIVNHFHLHINITEYLLGLYL